MTNKEKEEIINNLKETIFENCCTIGTMLQQEVRNTMYYNTIRTYVEYLAYDNNLTLKVVPTPDEEMGTAGAQYCPITNEIKIRESLCIYQHIDGDAEEILQNTKKLATTFQYLSHEIAHIIDDRINPITDDIRDKWICRSFERIEKLSEIHPEKEMLYKNFGLSIYFTSPSEVFANQLSHKKTIEFFKDLVIYAKNKYPYDKILDEVSMNDISVEKQLKLFVNGNLENYLKCKYSKHFLECAHDNYQTWEKNFKEGKAFKMKFQEEVHADFVAVAHQWLKNPTSVPLTEDDIYELLTIKELYDEEFVDMWYQTCLNHSDIEKAELLLKIKEKRVEKTKTEQQNANLNVDEIPHAPDNIATMKEDLEKALIERLCERLQEQDFRLIIENGQLVKRENKSNSDIDLHSALREMEEELEKSKAPTKESSQDNAPFTQNTSKFVMRNGKLVVIDDNEATNQQNLQENTQSNNPIPQDEIEK